MPSAAHAQGETLTLEPQAGANLVGDPHTLTATLRSASGEPLPGYSVTFILNTFSLLYCTEVNYFVVTTDAQGRAVCSYTNNSIGTDTISASVSVEGTSLSATATKTWLSRAAETLELSPETGLNVVGHSHCLGATQRDAEGRPTNRPVRFSISGPNSAATFDESNCYTGNAPGTDTISAYVDNDNDNVQDQGEPTDTATKRWLAEAPLFTLTPGSAENEVGTNHTLTATLTTAQGEPLPGYSVTFILNTFSLLYCTEVNYFVVTTDAQGKAVCSYTNNSIGTDTISASVSGIGGANPSATATKTWTSAIAETLELSPETGLNVVGHSHCLGATQRDAEGRPTNRPVRFSISGPNSAATFDESNCYTGNAPGTDTISAYVDNDNDNVQDQGEPTDTATKRWLAEAPLFTLTPGSAENEVGTNHTLTATLTTAQGEPLPGYSVTFILNTFSLLYCTEVNYFVVTTDAQGKAVCSYTNNSIGTDTISASVSGIGGANPSATATKTWTSAIAETLELSPETGLNVVGHSHCLGATQRDAEGRPTNRPVRFSISGPNSAATFDESNCYTGNAPGTDTISAYVDNDNDNVQDQGEPTDTATKRWLAEAPLFTLTPGSAENEVGTNHTLTATLTTAQGEPLPGYSVTFILNTFSLLYCTEVNYFVVTTDAQGKAVCSYTNNSIGTDTISASVSGIGGANPSATATKTWLRANPPTALTITPTRATNLTNLVDTQHCATVTARGAEGALSVGWTIRFLVSGANAAVEPANVPTNASGQSPFCYPGTSAGSDTIRAFADNNDNGTRDDGEPEVTATKLWLSEPPDTITLAPPTGLNPVGTSHFLTATVTDAGSAIPDVRVVFQVSGTNPTAERTEVTDTDGKASFNYSGGLEGSDTITAFVDMNLNGTKDENEPSATASKEWTREPPTAVSLSPTSVSNPIGSEHCVTATVTDRLGRRQGNRLVRFSVTGVNGPEPRSTTTGANGEARYCYVGNNPGGDTITAFADINANLTLDAGEPQGEATKTWTGVPPPDVTIDDVSLLEGDSGSKDFSFTVTLSQAGTGTVTVDYETADGTATQPSDYTSTSGQLSFAQGELTKTITVPVVGDTDVEDNENFLVNLTGSSPNAQITDSQGEGTIENDDAVVPDVTIDDVSLLEGDSGSKDFSFTVTLSQAGTGTVTVDYETADGTATQPSDYTSTSGQLSFAQGELTKTITVPVVGDTDVEDNENFLVNLTGSSPNAQITDSQGEGTIENDDAVVPDVTIDDVSLLEGDSGSKDFSFTVTLSQAGTGTVTVDYETADGTATQPSDYTSTSGQLSFAQGELTKTITVPVVGDTDVEDNENFLVNLTGSSPNAQITDNQGLGTIENDDETPIPPPDVTIDNVSLLEGDSGTKDFTFTVTLSQAGTGTVTVDYETADGTATQPSDYTSTSGQLSFAQGELTKTITVPVVGDTDVEDNENFLVNLTGSSPNAQITDSQGEGTIENDDAVVPDVTIDDVSLLEGDSGSKDFSFTVTLSQAGTGTVTVDYETADGTATQPSDYTSTSGQLSFAQGELTKTITVPVVGDTTVEPDEAFFVNLTGSSANARILDEQGLGTIENDDQAPPPPASLVLSPASATNNVGQQHCVIATVRAASQTPSAGVVVRFSVSGANTMGGIGTTAANGEARFCYTGVNAGDDTIRAFADSDGDGTQSAGEPGGEATKRWVGEPPPGEPGCDVEVKGWLKVNSEVARVKLDVESGPPPEGKVRFKVHGNAPYLKSTEITQVLVASDERSATIIGLGSLKGAPPVQSRIEVRDLPTAPDTVRIQFGDYDSGERTVRKGGVDIECDDGDRGKGNGNDKKK